MDRTTLGASTGVLQPRIVRRLVGLLAAAMLAAGCGQSPAAPTFALAFQNASDLALRVNVVVAPGQKPAHSLEIPAGSGVLEIAESPMGWTGTEPVPVVVELYTDTCALLDSVTVGRGTTLVHVQADRSVVTSATTLSGGSGAVAPELKPPC